ncbi:MAG: tRNA (guanosine(37)-N1)-methyltransferase TrmD [Leptospiraceae bacterium]|nr:tRNA (guanosine(37)-N1)-methyltransferase TrmD [Leptospiraceae bacterium]
MRFQILTLFPERFADYTKSGLPARAISKKLFELYTLNIRDFADPARKGRIDDAPYGGGPGMILEVGPIDRALQALPERSPVVLFTPRGRRLDQQQVRAFTALPGLTLLSGYFEGVDERVAQHLVDYQVSLGDFVLGSGDLPALCLIEAITRLIPGYMGSDESHLEESNEDGLLEYPQYTRPATYGEWAVPEVLLSGNHQAVRVWRQERQQEITAIRNKENG